MKRFLLFVILFATSLMAQIIGGGGTQNGTGAPAGACNAGALYTDNATGTVYGCNAGSWIAVGPGAAGATTLDSVQNPTVNKSFDMATYSLVWNWATGNTSTTNLFSVADNATNTGTGYLFTISSGSGSATKPARICYRGTTDCPLVIDTTTLTTAGSAVIDATKLSGAIGGSSPAAITGTTITANTGFSGNLTGNVTGDVTGTASGNELPLTFSAPLGRSTNTISIPASTDAVDGYMTAADHTSFTATVALAANALQNSGNQTISAGGLTANFFADGTGTPAGAGVFRLANNSAIYWKNSVGVDTGYLKFANDDQMHIYGPLVIDGGGDPASIGSPTACSVSGASVGKLCWNYSTGGNRPAYSYNTAAYSNLLLASDINAASGVAGLDGSSLLTPAQLPNPAAAAKGGIKSKDCSASGATYGVQIIGTDASVTCADFASVGAGTTLTVDSVSLSATANLSSTTPAAQANNVQVVFQKDASATNNVSGEVPYSSTYLTTSAGALTFSTAAKRRGIIFPLGSTTGSALTTSDTAYVVVPIACTISGYSLLIDASDTTLVVKFWKVASGTAIPTVANSISTSGLGVSSGTAVISSTVTDFTSTAVSANDIIAMNVSTANTAKMVVGELQCDQ